MKNESSPEGAIQTAPPTNRIATDRNPLARPFRAWDEWGAVFLGRCPRLVSGAPLALNPGTSSRIFATASDASANWSNFRKSACLFLGVVTL